jgi:hypothetical protein
VRTIRTDAQNTVTGVTARHPGFEVTQGDDDDDRPQASTGGPPAAETLSLLDEIEAERLLAKHSDLAARREL